MTLGIRGMNAESKTGRRTLLLEDPNNPTHPVEITGGCEVEEFFHRYPHVHCTPDEGRRVAIDLEQAAKNGEVGLMLVGILHRLRPHVVLGSGRTLPCAHYERLYHDC